MAKTVLPFNQSGGIADAISAIKPKASPGTYELFYFYRNLFKYIYRIILFYLNINIFKSI